MRRLPVQLSVILLVFNPGFACNRGLRKRLRHRPVEPRPPPIGLPPLPVVPPPPAPPPVVPPLPAVKVITEPVLPVPVAPTPVLPLPVHLIRVPAAVLPVPAPPDSAPLLDNRAELLRPLETFPFKTHKRPEENEEFRQSKPEKKEKHEDRLEPKVELVDMKKPKNTKAPEVDVQLVRPKRPEAPEDVEMNVEVVDIGVGGPQGIAGGGDNFEVPADYPLDAFEGVKVNVIALSEMWESACKALACNFRNRNAEDTCSYKPVKIKGAGAFKVRRSRQRTGNNAAGVPTSDVLGVNVPWYMGAHVPPMSSAIAKSAPFSIVHDVFVRFDFYESANNVDFKVCFDGKLDANCHVVSEYGVKSSDRLWRRAQIRIPKGENRVLFFISENIGQQNAAVGIANIGLTTSDGIINCLGDLFEFPVIRNIS